MGGDGTPDWKLLYRIVGPGVGEEKLYRGEWVLSQRGSVLIEVIWPWPGTSSTLSGSAPRLTCGEYFWARECHLSLWSPSRKFPSAQRGCGLPALNVNYKLVFFVENIVPRSSLTKLSNSAIRFLSRVLSSNVGSSLKRRSQYSVNLGFILDHKRQTLRLGHQFHRRTVRSNSNKY